MDMLRSALAEHPFFIGCPPYILDLVTGCAREANFDADSNIFVEGGAANTFYLLRSGDVALTMDAPGGDVVTVETLGAGEALGWSWLFPPYLWHFTARVVQPVSAIALDAVCLRAQCDADHDLGYEVMRRVSAVIIQRLHETRLRLIGQQGPQADMKPTEARH